MKNNPMLPQKMEDAYSTRGFLKTANDFFKYLVIDFKNYTKQAKLFFQNKKTNGKNTMQEQKENEIHQQVKTISINKFKKNQNMSNLRNSVRLIGRLGSTPEVRQLESGRYVANVSIATNDIYKNDKGDKIVETQWHRLVAWGKTAELFQKLLSKGDEVAIEGKLTHQTYEDKDGITRNSTKIVVNEFVKLTSRAVTVQAQVA